MCWVHINALPEWLELLLNWRTVTWVRRSLPPRRTLRHCAQSEGTQIKLQRRHTSYMNEHTCAVSGVRCGMWGQQVCGMPEATYVLDLMGSISMDHLILPLIHFWGCISGTCGYQFQSVVILVQLGIRAIKVAQFIMVTSWCDSTVAANVKNSYHPNCSLFVSARWQVVSVK